MGAADKVFGAFRNALSNSKQLSESDRSQLMDALQAEIEKEPPPVLAIIGESGVGKSSTLNALFNAGATVGHHSSTTKNADGFDVEIFDHHGNRGDIRILDLPGLGESLDAAPRLKDVYAQALPQADAILWVHPAFDRMLEFTQTKLIELFGAGARSGLDRLVFGLNKADAIYPGDWRSHANIPSDAQMENLQQAEKNFSGIVSQALPRGARIRVTTYSATRRFNLSRLFRMMMEAVPERRRWVLESRMDIANFLDFADPRYVEGLRARGFDISASSTPPPRDEIINQMSSDDLRFILKNHISPEAWWQKKWGK